MATINELMPYLEQGYTAADHTRIGPAYLEPRKQDGVLVFRWRAYQMEGEWTEPVIHSADYVRTWKSNEWGIVCSSHPNGSGEEYTIDEPKKIEQAIADGKAHKLDGFA